MTSTTAGPMIAVRDVSKQYPRGAAETVHALRDVTFAIEAGE